MVITFPTISRMVNQSLTLAQPSLYCLISDKMGNSLARKRIKATDFDYLAKNTAFVTFDVSSIYCFMCYYRHLAWCFTILTCVTIITLLDVLLSSHVLLLSPCFVFYYHHMCFYYHLAWCFTILTCVTIITLVCYYFVGLLLITPTLFLSSACSITIMVSV